MSVNDKKLVVRIIRTMDPVTGELMEGIPVSREQYERHFWERHFVNLFLGPLHRILPRLNGESSRVLMYLISTIGMNNQWTVLVMSQIADYLGMNRSQVHRALNGLIEMGVVLKGAKMGTRHAYALNPEYGWYGHVKDHKNALKTMKPPEPLRGEAQLVYVHSMSLEGNGGFPTVIKGDGVTIVADERERVTA